MFRNPLSLIGSKGRTILKLKKGAKSRKKKYKPRKTYELNFNWFFS